MAGGRQNAIFIGYRRDDTQDTAGRVYDRLVAAFGEKAVFKDVDNLPIGTDFGDYILGLLPRCRVFLALIGPGWLDAKDETGRRRLDDPHDWVRIELETAFATPGLQIVPVLVNGARMPRSDELPESLRRLTRFNAAMVRRDPDFSTDMARMVEALRASVKSGALDLAGLGGERKPVSSAARKPGEMVTKQPVGGGARWLFRAGAAVALVLLLVWHPWSGAGSPPLAGGSSAAPGHYDDEGRWQSSSSQLPRDNGGANYTPGQVIKDCTSCPEVIVVPGGLFLMGSPTSEPGRSSDESPQREVSIPQFAIGKYEVTFHEWDACLAGGGCGGFSPADHGWGRGNRPVLGVSWNDAQHYIDWLNTQTNGRHYRLATEAEWEYAARAGETGAYTFHPYLTTAKATYRAASTSPIGSYAANAFGIFDAYGNASEWVQDCYAANYTLAPIDGAAVDPSDCSRRVYRGGSFADQADALRAAARRFAAPDTRLPGAGFRVVLSLT
jgi:formylglycine-generating enzyme required for sulfatase activity